MADLQAEFAEYQAQQPPRRGRSSSAPARRRATSAPAQPRQRRRRTTAASEADAAAAGSSHAAGAGSSHAGQPQQPPAQAFFAAMEAEQRDWEAAFVEEPDQEAPSAWQQRCQQDEDRWRAAAPQLGAAMLRQHAAPDHAERCSICDSSGCTIRYAFMQSRQAVFAHISSTAVVGLGEYNQLFCWLRSMLQVLQLLKNGGIRLSLPQL